MKTIIGARECQKKSYYIDKGEGNVDRRRPPFYKDGWDFEYITKVLSNVNRGITERN